MDDSTYIRVDGGTRRIVRGFHEDLCRYFKLLYAYAELIGAGVGIDGIPSQVERVSSGSPLHPWRLVLMAVFDRCCRVDTSFSKKQISLGNSLTSGAVGSVKLDSEKCRLDAAVFGLARLE